MTRDEAIKILEPYTGPGYQGIKFRTACEVAVSSLRAQQPPAKLDRSRWEGCEHCVGDDPKSIGTFEVYKKIKNPEDAIKFKWAKAPQYCPMCGKPLTEAAWAELERRISNG